MSKQGFASFLKAYGFEEKTIEKYMEEPYELANEMVDSMSCHDCTDYHTCNPRQAETCKKAFCKGFVAGYEKRK